MTAIQIYKNVNGKYKFDVSTFKQIFNTTGDNFVAIYSMTGPLRLGKSFMLGFFLKYLQNKEQNDWISKDLPQTFKYRGGSVRETTGIWIWSEPFIIEQNGCKISVFLMDTQGCFDQESSTVDNAFVFAMSTLLSSVTIFNIKRQLSEDILQFLQYFAGFARFADENQSDEPFQRLMFLIRDFEFTDYPYGYYDDNTSIEGKNYKKISLDIREDQPREVKYVHESIINNFETVSFYLMPHPGKEVSRNSKFDIEKVDEDFLLHIGKFVPMVLNPTNVVIKKIGGENITGNQFIQFVEKWAEMFESATIPEGKTIHEATAEIHNEMAKSAAINNYSSKLKAQLNISDGMTEKDLKILNSAAMEDSIDLFKSFKRLGGTAYEIKYLKLLNKEMNIIFETFHEMNLSKLKCKESQIQFEIEKNRLDFEIKENERKLKELKEENEMERQRMIQILEENKRKMKLAEEKAEKERQLEQQRVAALQKQLWEAENKPPVIIQENSRGCTKRCTIQ